MTPKQEAALRLALEAMNLARAAHGQILLSDPPQEAWKAWGVSAALTKAMTAASEALAEQQSGIKQVIELYDSPEQPAQQQEPVAWMFQHEETGRTMCVDAQQVEWGFEKGNPRLKKIAPLYTSPRPSKPWVGLTEEDRLEIWKKSTNIDGAINATATKLREKNNG